MKKRSRKAQITVFMILGLLILFVALFVVMLSINVKKSSLQGEQEKILTQAFKKEALRVYAEDCLKDTMEEGIDLLAKQGRIWADQPGGSEEFIDEVTGVNDGEGRIYYGISRKIFSQGNAFPCKEEANTPAFCGYSYPQTAEFGQWKLRKDILFQKDLKNFLINRTVWCVENFTKSNISQETVVSTNLELNLEETDEGINVAVNYPLKIKLNKEELFHLTTFDFFYPTKFKQVVDVAMIYPLQWDQKFVDFNYDDDTLNADYFEYNSSADVKENCLGNDAGGYTCKRKTLKDKYKALGMKIQKEQVNANGDDIFTFTTPIQNVFSDRSGDFTLQIARQNRPPAIDYVHRENCSEKGYDYLVILGDEKLGEVDINLSAHDADEDNIVNYKFDSIPGLLDISKGKEDIKDNNLFISADKITPNLGIKTISVQASDEHGLPDWQEVRVLIDKQMRTSFKIDIPYTINKEGKLIDYGDFFKEGKYYLISQEDPFVLKLQLPTVNDVKQSAELRYNSSVEGENFDLNVYNLELIKQGKVQITAPNFDKEKFEESKIDEQRNYFNAAGEGVLSLSYARAYCNKDKTEVSEAKIEVKQCIPHVNPEYPYAYPYNKYNFGLDDQGKTNLNEFKGEKEINPFFATHSCCNSDWTIKDNKQVCFTNPEKSCGGEGYWLGNLVVKCDGKSGNRCEGQSEFNLIKKNTVSVNNLCGNVNYKNCNTNIPLECREKEAWGLVDDGKKWCFGDHGCEKVCETEIVSIANLNFDKINSHSTQFKCGCGSSDDNFKCKNLRNGVEGKCMDKGCQ